MCYGPKKSQNIIYVYTIQNTFGDKNCYQRSNIGEKNMTENASLQGYFTKLSFDTPEGNKLFVEIHYLILKILLLKIKFAKTLISLWSREAMWTKSHKKQIDQEESRFFAWNPLDGQQS